MGDKVDSKPLKKVMTDKQKNARLLNLEKGRLERKETLKQKQESKGEEYNLSSDESESNESESDNDAFVISRKKKIVPRDVVERSRKSIQMERDPKNHDNLQKDFDELKGMVQELANMQKKQAAKSKSKRSNGGTKIVVLPQNTSSNNNNRSSNDSVMDALRKSLM